MSDFSLSISVKVWGRWWKNSVDPQVDIAESSSSSGRTHTFLCPSGRSAAFKPVSVLSRGTGLGPKLAVMQKLCLRMRDLWVGSC